MKNTTLNLPVLNPDTRKKRGLGSLIQFSAFLANKNGVLLSGFVSLNKTNKKLPSTQKELIGLVPFSKLFPIDSFRLKSLNVFNGELDNTRSMGVLTDYFHSQLYFRLFYNFITNSFKLWFEELELVGLGYRLTVKENTVRFRLGFSHVLILSLPPSVFLLKRKKRLLFYSTDKISLSFFISRLFNLRKMSAYKVKGIKKKTQVFNLKPGKKRAK